MSPIANFTTCCCFITNISSKTISILTFKRATLRFCDNIIFFLYRLI